MIRFAQFVILCIMSSTVLAAPSSQYWSLWDKSDAEMSQTINHGDWQGILDHYLVPRPDGNLFKYQKVTNEDDKKIDDYINQLTAIDPRKYGKSEQKAYWINLYNALTVDLILKNYPVKSITNIGSFFNFGPWNRTLTSVEGQPLTLNDIEHRILRPLWNDKRIHYAVNCASLGCPDLSPRAYTGANVESQLNAQAQRFIQQDKGVSWVDGKLVLSRIYEWYQVDFGSKEDLMGHLLKHSSSAQRKRLLKYTGIADYRYNWRLNEWK